MVDKTFALSGSLVTGNLENLGKIASALESHDEQVLVVTGAGALKEYIYAAGKFGNQGEQDLVGIAATRLNASTLSTAMNAYPKIPETAYEIREATSTGQNVVMGGLTPGHSTDAVAAIAAEITDSDLYIATSIDGVYDMDPEEEGAEKFDKISSSKLRTVINGNNEAGGHELIDGTAVDIIERSKIKTRLFEGTVENIQNPEKAEGTTIFVD